MPLLAASWASKRSRLISRQLSRTAIGTPLPALPRGLCWLTNEMLDDPDSTQTRKSFSGISLASLMMKYAVLAMHPGLPRSL